MRGTTIIVCILLAAGCATSGGNEGDAASDPDAIAPDADAATDPDAAGDPAGDPVVDVAEDGTADAVDDPSPDASTDTTPDAGLDTAADTVTDVRPDAPTDVGTEEITTMIDCVRAGGTCVTAGVCVVCPATMEPSYGERGCGSGNWCCVPGSTVDTPCRSAGGVCITSSSTIACPPGWVPEPSISCGTTGSCCVEGDLCP